jgi:hypothetical protein
MDTSLRKNIAARDAAPAKTRRAIRRVAAPAAAASLVPAGGFAHLIPTHPPHLSVGGTGTGGRRSGTGHGSGTPGSGSGPFQVFSGGS